MEFDAYDVAQVCLNGHTINSSARSEFFFNEDFCSSCGAATITECPTCATFIRGRHWNGYHDVYDRPAFCFQCGSAFPWTKKSIEAAQTLADDSEGLNAEEKTLLKSSIVEIVESSPQTPIAVNRVRKLIAKAGTSTASAFREILVDVVSEAVKKALFP